MIILITPTGCRPDQFKLCTEFMRRQTYSGKVVWIIVDDGYPRTTEHITEAFRPDWPKVKIYPTPTWRTGENTQVRNLQAGIDYIKANFQKQDVDGIFIIEDDDYYRPQYLERMTDRLKGFDIVGEKNTIYYNVEWRRHVTNANAVHASLFQTAFSYDAIPDFEASFAHKFIDCLFWTKPARKNLFNEGNLAIGMKGIPGRGGIGAGHRRAQNMQPDPYLHYLRSLVGEDVKFYERYYKEIPHHNQSFFTKKR
jgi:hypothetical protein